MKRLNNFLANNFIFSPRYRIWRHVVYWSFHTVIWATFWMIMGAPTSFERQLFNMALWIPVFILFGYPLVYGAIPHLLLKGKVTLFFLVVLGWGGIGLIIDTEFRSYVLIPLQEYLGLDHILPRGPIASCYLCMATSAASPMVIKFYKLVTIKQQDWIFAQQEKITAELQLLKAQVHPQFLLNTLNSIHSFSLARSPKTPVLILKLSSLLSYMLYDCKGNEVRLEKEIDAMKNYIDLERERSRDKIEISWNLEGNYENRFISPLLLLPFLENAFKHGLADEIETSWLSIDISVKSDVLRCKIANSKSEFLPYTKNGMGISNVRKRLEIAYPGRHEVKINDEGNFFVVSLQVKLVQETTTVHELVAQRIVVQPLNHRTTVSVYR